MVLPDEQQWTELVDQLKICREQMTDDGRNTSEPYATAIAAVEQATTAICGGLREQYADRITMHVNALEDSLRNGLIGEPLSYLQPVRRSLDELPSVDTTRIDVLARIDGFAAQKFSSMRGELEQELTLIIHLFEVAVGVHTPIPVFARFLRALLLRDMFSRTKVDEVRRSLESNIYRCWAWRDRACSEG